MNQSDDIATAKCHCCGAQATEAVFGAGSFGATRSFLCDAHFAEARECCRRMLEITGFEKYAVPPRLRS